MVKFIVDANVDLSADGKNHIRGFFEDMPSRSDYVVVVGGAEMKREYAGKSAFKSLLIEWGRSGRVKRIPAEEVDSLDEEIELDLVKCFGSCPSECDDHHIFAFRAVSGTRFVVGGDNRMRKCWSKANSQISSKKMPKLTLVKTERIYKKLKKEGAFS
jgi:hypothetical protein